MKSDNSQSKPIELDATHLITNGPGHVFTQLKGTITVKPREQSRMSLGTFNDTKPPKGFSIEVNPEDAESVVSQITSLGTSKRYELILHIANYGDVVVDAEVWSL
jgi:hypothetical protein